LNKVEIMAYCTETDLYSFLNLKIPFQDVKNDLTTAITVASAWIDAQINMELPTTDQEIMTLAKEACLFYAGSRILMQYWEKLQIDNYEMDKINQYEKRAKELVQAVIYRLNKIQDVIDEDDTQNQKFIPVLDYAITE